MGFSAASLSFTRFKVLDTPPDTLWAELPSRLKQFSFIDIDNTAEERAFGWANFDDMFDTAWRISPPEKAQYITFTLRLETRRVPPAVLKKHVRLAFMEEEARLATMGKSFIPRDRKKELTDLVKLKLMARFLPIPSETQIVWNRDEGLLYVASANRNTLDLFLDLFIRTFDLHIEQISPYSLATMLMGEAVSEKLDNLEPSIFAG